MMIKMNLQVLKTLRPWTSCDSSSTVHILSSTNIINTCTNMQSLSTSANFIQIHTYTNHINTCTILILTCTINNTCTIHVINTCPINSNEFFITSPPSSDCNGRRKLERIYMRKTTSATQSRLNGFP